MENFDFGIFLGIIGVILTIYFGISHVTKNSNQCKTKNSQNIKVGKNTHSVIKQINSHNTTQCNTSKKDGE